MKLEELRIAEDISQATALPASFYRAAETFDLCREKIFARSWHCIGLASDLPESGHAQPFNLMPDHLAEPLLLVRDEQGKAHCFSNVCTHRGNMLIQNAGPYEELRCGYHGRCFDLHGKIRTAPAFEGVKNFPAPSDHLPELPLHTMGNLLFTAIQPLNTFESWIKPLQERLSWLPWNDFVHAPEYGQSYDIAAHWALYLNNYLQGFHTPYVSAGQNGQSEVRHQYETFPSGSLRKILDRNATHRFQIPASSRDYGNPLVAYQFFLFPHLMLDIYPWGMNLRLLEPISIDFSRLRVETFIWQEDAFNPDVQEILHLKELEEIAMIGSVQQGLHSRMFPKSRFSPGEEVAVHHFHKLLAGFMGK